MALKRIVDLIGRASLTPRSIALGYVLVSAAWIVFSDRILIWIGADLSVAHLTRLQTLKGILYVSLTAGFIYLLVSIAARRVRSSETELEQVETGYRELFHKTGAIILIVDAGTGLIVDANRAAEQFYGWSRGELATKPLSDLVVSAESRGQGELFSAIEDQPFLAGRHRTASGDERDIAVNSTPVAAPNRTLHFLLIHDVTEQRALELQLRQAQKMEAVGQLTGGIAHDLNNILTVVLADADLIAAELKQAGSADVRSDLDDLRAAARRGASMIRKLLSFSRSANLTMLNLDLGETVSGFVPTLRRLLPETIEIISLDRSAGFVRADQVALEQIVLNLATNAQDAMRKGGSLRLETGNTRLEANHQRPWVRPGQYAYLKVRDTGVGMDERTRSKVFEPFFTTKSPSEGTGLGMAMIYGLVKQHEGFVFVDSKPGEGTTVSIYLPSVPRLDQAEASAEYGDSSSAAGGETILLVEDEDALRRAGQRILEKLGYRVIEAPDGERALEILKEKGGDIQLVITDLIMPKVGGRALYEAARGRQQGIRFLFTSGYAQMGPGEGIPLPDVPFIQKPWTLDELGRKVKEVLSRPA
jgi:two-component system, cell cycle sensor histidine kinase and response regulator CckA